MIITGLPSSSAHGAFSSIRSEGVMLVPARVWLARAARSARPHSIARVSMEPGAVHPVVADALDHLRGLRFVRDWVGEH